MRDSLLHVEEETGYTQAVEGVVQLGRLDLQAVHPVEDFDRLAQVRQEGLDEPMSLDAEVVGIDTAAKTQARDVTCRRPYVRTEHEARAPPSAHEPVVVVITLELTRAQEIMQGCYQSIREVHESIHRE